MVVLIQEGKWLFVAAVDQRIRGNEWGQVGWVPAEQVCSNDAYLRAQLQRAESAVCVPRALLFRDDCLTEPVLTLSYQVRLPILAEREDIFKVLLPDGVPGYVSHDQMLRSADLCFQEKYY